MFSYYYPVIISFACKMTSPYSCKLISGGSTRSRTIYSDSVSYWPSPVWMKGALSGAFWSVWLDLCSCRYTGRLTYRYKVYGASLILWDHCHLTFWAACFQALLSPNLSGNCLPPCSVWRNAPYWDSRTSHSASSSTQIASLNILCRREYAFLGLIMELVSSWVCSLQGWHHYHRSFSGNRERLWNSRHCCCLCFV